MFDACAWAGAAPARMPLYGKYEWVKLRWFVGARHLYKNRQGFMFKLLIFCVTCALSFAAGGALAAYPDKPITLIVGFAPKTETELYAFIFKKHITKYLNNVQINIEYIPGNIGEKSTQYLITRPSDGYTLSYGRVANLLINPTINPEAGYRVDSFTTLGVLEQIPSICVVNAASPYKNADSLMAAIKQATRPFKFSSVGARSAPFFSARYMLFLSGVDFGRVDNVTAPNGADSVALLANGSVDFACENASLVIPLIKQGKLRGLFTTAPGRMAAVPDLPNAREVGFRDMHKMTSWTALAAPKDLPDEVLKAWRLALQKLSEDAEWQREVKAVGGFPALQLIQNPARYLDEQSQLYDQLSVKFGER